LKLEGGIVMESKKTSKILYILIFVLLVFQYVTYGVIKDLKSENQILRSRVDQIHNQITSLDYYLSSRVNEMSELLKGQYETLKEVKWESRYENKSIIIESTAGLYKSKGDEVIWLNYKDKASGETKKVLMENSGGAEYYAEFEAKPNVEYNYWLDINGELTGSEVIPEQINRYEAFRFLFRDTEVENNRLKSARILVGLEIKPYLEELRASKVYINVFDAEGKILDKIDIVEHNFERVKVPDSERENFRSDKLMLMMAAGDFYVDLNSEKYDKPITWITSECLYNSGEKFEEVLFEDGNIK